MFRLIRFFLLVAFVSLGYFFYTGGLDPYLAVPVTPSDSSSSTVPAVNPSTVVPTVPTPPVSAPPPLRVETPTTEPEPVEAGQLTRSGIISLTNAERVKAGLQPLTMNAELNLAAEIKARDMLAGQYFEHVSPSGVDAGALIRGVGYEYVLVGENLALGKFDLDSALVQGWMDSPGHRANILKPDFREIGVGLVYGLYEGKNIWLAVQEFGTPKSACPEPDVALRTSLDQQNATLRTLEADLNARQQELEVMREKRDPAYNGKVDEYNAVLGQYNPLVVQTRAVADQYNASVQAYNACLAEFSS